MSAGEGASLDLLSPDSVSPGEGTQILMPSLQWHVLQATYTQAGGQPIRHWPLTWSTDLDLATAHGFTGSDGVMTNAVQCTTVVSVQTADVKVAADGTSDSNTQTLYFTTPNVTPADDQGVMLITSEGGNPLSLNWTHKLSVTYYQDDAQTLVPDGTEVTWIAYPSDRLTFGDGGPGSNKSKTSRGVATIEITPSAGDAIPLAVIGTSATNPSSGLNDHAWPDLVVQFQAEQGIQIQPPGPLTLYDSHQLTVTVGNPQVKEIFWTTGPEDPPPAEGQPGHTFMFDNFSTRPFNGKGTINITSVGPNTNTKVTVYARSFDDTPMGSAELQFVAVENPPKSTLGVTSVEGTPFRNSDQTTAHLVMATYVDANGNPLPGEIKWGPDITFGFALLGDETEMLGDGTTTNAVTFSYDSSFGIGITATAPDGATAQLSAAALPYAPLPSITITSDATAHQLTATYPGAADGTEVLWEAFPADQVQFAKRMTQTESGSTQNTITYTGEAAFTAYISASSFNTKEGTRDYGTLQLTLTPVQQAEIEITSEETPPLSLYAPHTLDATYTGPDVQKVTSYVWSADPASDPQHTYQFAPNPSPATGGKASTQITGLGPNTTTEVTVHARAVGLDDGELHSGALNLAFKANASPPASAYLRLVSVDGNPLSTNSPHLIQAVCTTAEGDPLPGQAVDWSANPAGVTLQTTEPTPTDKNGIATNVVSATNPVTGSVTACLDNDHSVTDVLGLIFQSGDVTLPGQGTMTITSADRSPLSLGEDHLMTVQYLDGNQNPMPKGTQITWTGFPIGMLCFAKDTTQVLDDQGNSINFVMGLGVSDIPSAVITTMAFNEQIQANDHGELATSFTYSSQPAKGLVGIVLDKAYCQTPRRNQPIKPNDLTQVIKCQVQANGAQGQQTVRFPFNPEAAPPSAPPTLYDSVTGKELPKEDGIYYTLTAEGSDPPTATILAGSIGYALFTLGAVEDGQIQDHPPVAGLVIGTNRGEQSQLWLAPTVPDADATGNLTIPNQLPAPTFKVFLPTSSTLTADDPVAFLLNDRLVYNGAAGPGLRGGPGFDVAYAAVLADGSENTLVYVVPGGESAPDTFTASGNAQTAPAPSLSRALPAPQVAGSLTQIGPADIVSWLDTNGAVQGGLPVQINAYSGVAIGDQITVYVYLTGEDALTSLLTGAPSPAFNIVPIPYKVQKGDPLLVGTPVVIYLPQWAAAGYGNGTAQKGTLRIDYCVARGSDTQWSAISPTYTLNTTF